MGTSDKIRIGGHQFSQPSRIYKLISQENYTEIWFRSGEKTLVATTLGKLENRLQPFGFCRPNRFTVINNAVVCDLLKVDGHFELTTTKAENIKISKRRVAQIREEFGVATV